MNEQTENMTQRPRSAWNRLTGVLAPLRLVAAAGMVAATLAVAPFGIQHAGATISACGGCPSFDPVARLSNGVSIRMWVEVDDSVSDVQNITYTLHVPAGVSVTDVSYDGPAPQTMQVVTDGRGSAYRVDTLVTTGTPAATVISHVTATGRGNPASGLASGLSNSPVSVLFSLSGPGGHGNGGGQGDGNGDNGNGRHGHGGDGGSDSNGSGNHGWGA